MLILKDKKFKDKSGEPVYFKEPYFDSGMRRRFETVKEKAEYMNKNGIVQRGDSDEKVKKQRKEYEENKKETRR